MKQYLTANTSLFILCLILHISLTSGTALLRSSSTKEQPTLQDALIKLQELESLTIPRLVENIARLEEVVSELEEHRRLTASCGFVLSTDGTTCQLNAPVALLSGLTVQGRNTKIMGNVTVEGNTVLKGGSTRILSSNVNITGMTSIKDLIVGNSFEVLGESIFDSNIEVIQDAIMDHGLTTKGHAHFHDLEVDKELDIKGETTFEDSVSIRGSNHDLHVYGDVTIEHKLTVEGDTILQDVTQDGQLVFNNKVVFNDDVEMDKLQVQDLTIDGSLSSVIGTKLRSSSTKDNKVQEPSTTTLQDVLTKLQEIETRTIPSLLESISSLEAKISDLEDHRRLTDSCSFVLSSDGSTCQLTAPVTFLSDVTVRGNTTQTKIFGDLTVEGNTVLKGGSTRILSGNVNVTGTATIHDLIVNNSFEVVGESIFDSSIEVIRDALLDHGLTTKGHAHFFDLEVDDELDIKGRTLLEDSVSIRGTYSDLHVEGDVTIDKKLTVDGETVLQDVTEEGVRVFNNKVVFNDDVEMDNLQVQDLIIAGSCDGCV